jgi:hypothetical protein
LFIQGIIYSPASRLSFKTNLSPWERVRDPMEISEGEGVCSPEGGLFMTILVDEMFLKVDQSVAQRVSSRVVQGVDKGVDRGVDLIVFCFLCSFVDVGP